MNRFKLVGKADSKQNKRLRIPAQITGLLLPSLSENAPETRDPTTAPTNKGVPVKFEYQCDPHIYF